MKMLQKRKAICAEKEHGCWINLKLSKCYFKEIEFELKEAELM